MLKWRYDSTTRDKQDRKRRRPRSLMECGCLSLTLHLSNLTPFIPSFTLPLLTRLPSVAPHLTSPHLLASYLPVFDLSSPFT
ncbi:hypothetical protein Pmani_035369 [Petrolisthes manimaculis]|uniref:Uncharacterized protein n=1 Tax=Petrolisthes manimaculis TaxID=1843537 RepID=A0AAE1NMJ2_9EUCA|nr:hypothetical protein Pmani_035369 [Petrolisthes manimaculis]